MSTTISTGEQNAATNKLTVGEVRELYTNQILAALDNGVVPWRQPWQATSLPTNAITGKQYGGRSALILSCMPFSDPRWLTRKQANEAGGFQDEFIAMKNGKYKRPTEKTSVRKLSGVFRAARGVTLAARIMSKPKKGEEAKAFMISYEVFNVEQCYGVTRASGGTLPNLDDFAGNSKVIDPIAQAEAISSGYADGPIITVGGRSAHYNPLMDTIAMPTRNSFESAQMWHHVLFHEQAHSTGHPDRLNRKEVNGTLSFGSKDYGLEELTAQVAAGMLSVKAGLDIDWQNEAAYIGHWRDKIAGDNRLVLAATQKATHAVNYILGTK